MKVTMNGGNSLSYNINEISKIEFIPLTGATTLNLNITVVDHNYRPIPYVSISTQVAVHTGAWEACCIETRELNPYANYITDSQGKVSITLRLPECYDSDPGDWQDSPMNLRFTYRDATISTINQTVPGGCSYIDISRNMCTDITVFLDEIVLP